MTAALGTSDTRVLAGQALSHRPCPTGFETAAALLPVLGPWTALWSGPACHRMPSGQVSPCNPKINDRRYPVESASWLDHNVAAGLGSDFLRGHQRVSRAERRRHGEDEALALNEPLGSALLKKPVPPWTTLIAAGLEPVQTVTMLPLSAASPRWPSMPSAYGVPCTFVPAISPARRWMPLILLRMATGSGAAWPCASSQLLAAAGTW